ncbi:MAG: multidrug efflux RND transporter permease subunit [Pirellulaceae bacterium]
MFSHFFIDRPIFAGVISILIVLAGLIVLPALPVEQTPTITPPTVMVSTSFPGASAEVVSETVAIPIEEQVNGVENMIYMASKSTDDGTYELVVTFDVGTDIDMATVLVQNRVATALSRLPEEVAREGVTTEKQSTAIVLMVNILSPDGRYSEIDMSNFITTSIKDELARLPGIGKVDVLGAKDLAMRIWLDPARMLARSLTTTDIMGTIQEQNVQVPAGQLGAPPAPDGQNFQYTINAAGRLSNKEEFEDLILRADSDGGILRLKDVARVEEGAQTYRSEVKLNNAPSVAVAVYQLPTANSLQVSENVRARMVELQRLFPPGMEYTIAYDTTAFVKASIREVIITLFIAMVLVILTVYIFLQDFRTTLVPAVTIPVSLIGTFAVMMVLGFSINTLTLFGLVLAIGIVVDDAIVVVENAMRIIDEEGLSAKEATKKAMLQVSGPVIATTLVLLAVFVPTAFMGGITGRLYAQFSLTIAVSTIFSSINALTLSPALCGILLRPTPKQKVFLFRWFDRGLERSTNGYMSAVDVLIRKLAIVVVLFLLVTAAAAWGFLSVPGGFLPDEDQGYFMVAVQLPDGASMERTRAVLDQVDEILADTPGVADIVSVNGFSLLDSLIASNAATYFVVMDDWSERRTAETRMGSVVRGVQMKLMQIQEANSFAFIPPPIQGLGSAGGFDFRLRDMSNLGAGNLQDVANDLVVNGSQLPSLARLNNNFTASVPQMYLDIDTDKVKRLDLDRREVAATLQTYLGSAYVNDFNKFGRPWRVLVQADAPFRGQVDDIYQLQVRNKQGSMIPLRTLLTVEETAGPKALYRYNTVPSATITGQGAPGVSSGQAMQAMEQLAAQQLPTGMTYDWSSVSYQEKLAGNQAPIIFTLSVVFVYLFLCALYESWSIPWSVILSVPFALLGAIGLTAARGFDNNIYTQIGLVLLIGLATKTAILIVEFAKQEREAGRSIQAAASIAARLRFRAILMTAFSFILGVLPLLVASGAGAASRRSLGTAVFGGMTAATIVGLFLIPALYVLVQMTSEKIWPVAEPKRVEEE